ncbi:MAG: sulfatase [Planctomycetales bacterium]|nr:sulfatase [Planctomycetales bacterium]
MCLSWDASLCGQERQPTDAARSPNIVFILADDLAWSDLACYGNAIHDTPHIDELAKTGLRFTQAYAPAPICSASRAAILTGKTPARLQFEFVTKGEPGRQTFDTPLQSPPYTMNLPLGEVTMGEALSQAGYATGFFGKWHVNQHYRGYLGWSPTHGPRQQGFAHGASDFGSHPYGYRARPAARQEPAADGQFPADSLTDKAVAFIEQQRDKPFFLYLSQYYVHDPVHSRCRWLIDKYAQRLPPDAPPIRASYAAMIATLDHLIGRVDAALARAGVAEDTLLVLMSDNGGHPNYTSNAPLRGSKWNLYEGGIRVPLVVRWPGHVRPATTSDAIVHGCDLLPTFCQAAGARLPATSLDGRSLLSVFTGQQAAVRGVEPLVWHFPYYHPERGFDGAPRAIGVADFVTSQTRPHSAIRSGKWKLLHFYEHDAIELYDLESDTAEQTNLATLHPSVARELDKQLATYLSNVNARLPTAK